ncbi:hypothetical protein [Aphanothece sacrum]|nr:hypothetical protein [Aphanothece sacrum]
MKCNAPNLLGYSLIDLMVDYAQANPPYSDRGRVQVGLKNETQQS